MKSVISFWKKETVLSVALLLAAVSCCFVWPDRAYIEYLDFRTLVILFCLMCVMAGYKKIGVFGAVARFLLRKTGGVLGVTLVLVYLCFFFSMCITNDVALITFVPLTLIIFGMLEEKVREQMLLPVVALQTVAANLGSMLTPMGNPQNLYLYGQANMDFGEFLWLMLPYTSMAFAMILVWILVICKGKSKTASIEMKAEEDVFSRKKCLIYSLLFVLCLLCVAHILPYEVLLLIIVLVIGLVNISIFKEVDYSLLATFVAFFIFIGNMGRIESFREVIGNTLQGKEVVTAIIASQMISNVPAALLLSGFTDNLHALIVGTNLGGLGTLIASMASLISFKYIAREDKALRGKYLLYFTVVNLIFLLVEFLFYMNF